MEHDSGAATHTRVVLPEAARWELAAGLRRSADRSADLLRGLLFLLAAGIAAFAATRHFTLETMLFHVGALASAGLAMAMLVGTWMTTRAQNDARYRAIVTEGVDDEVDPSTLTVRDQVVCWFIFTAAALELFAILLHIEA
ncbi:MAG: hypothetical protein IT535_12440 [Bauldia sp.]|nr:hypothetical protein [Bauldia sp.]